MAKKKKKLKVIPLGGLGEIGKNITVFEYGEDIIVIDCGLAFPEDDMLGIDLVIPDITYLLKNASRVRGIILTHGHEDHIGALPYILREINVPVYGTKLTLGLVKQKLEEHGMLNSVSLNNISQGETLKCGSLNVEFIRTTHSIADSVAVAIHSPIGIIVFTSDFKIDFTPLESKTMDLARLAELGKKGVLLLMCDSTNVEREGYTVSERVVGKTFEGIFSKAIGRILIATFASNVHRLQQIINAALKFNRKIAICGRSMLNVVEVATSLGYMNIPEGTLIDIDNVSKIPDNKVVIITTGSQGEPMSALTRIAFSEHRKVEIIPNDLVIISASPIPGNEKFISKVINELFKKGADVVYESLAEIHVSGHACQEELKLIHTLVKPLFFAPVHGEYRHLKRHANLANMLGMSMDNIFILENGNVLELTANSAKINGYVVSGRVLVDGLGVGDVGNVVLRDRKLLSQDGLIIVALVISRQTGELSSGPDIISRGFVYVKESEDLIGDIKHTVKQTLNRLKDKQRMDWTIRKNAIKDDLRERLYEKTKRRPMILIVVTEI